MKAKLFNYGTDEPLIIQFEEEIYKEEEKTRFKKLKINDILFQYNKDKKILNIYKVNDIDNNTVYTMIIFSLNFYSTLSYFRDGEINNPANDFYLLSELEEKDIKEIKKLMFNKIIGLE